MLRRQLKKKIGIREIRDSQTLVQHALPVPPWSWLWVCHQAQPPFLTTSHSGGVTPFSDLFRVLGDSQERRYGAISLCHGHECELMDALVSPSLFPFPSVSICPSPLFCRVNWEKWVWMALMEKRSVILITFLFITRCFSEASKKHLESSKYSKVFFFFRETKVCLAPLERRDTLAGG